MQDKELQSLKDEQQRKLDEEGAASSKWYVSNDQSGHIGDIVTW